VENRQLPVQSRTAINYKSTQGVIPSTPRDRIETLRERIETSDDIDDADREVLLRFSDRLDPHARDYTDHRHEKLLRHCTIVAETLDGAKLTAALEDRVAAEEIVGWINRTYDDEETNRDYRIAVRVFGKRIAETDGDIETNDNGTPKSLSWVPTGTSSTYDPTPDPRDMLRWEERIEPMLDETYNSRDAAMIAPQFDAGLRGGEFKSLRVGDLQDHKPGLQVTVEGKRGRRTVTLILSAPYLNRWLADHPARQDPDAPLWSKLHEVERISDRTVSKVFDNAAERAGVSNPVTLTNFRKSSAAFLAGRNLNQAHIENQHGWVRGSKVAARYISVFGDDTDRELARLHGLDVSDDEPDSIAPLTCPRCDRETPRKESLCVRCGQAMSPEAAVEQNKVFDDFRDGLVSGSPEKAGLLNGALDTIDEHPERMSELFKVK
jgi:integrase